MTNQKIAKLVILILDKIDQKALLEIRLLHNNKKLVSPGLKLCLFASPTFQFQNVLLFSHFSVSEVRRHLVVKVRQAAETKKLCL